jgi:hypothetical protein
MGSRKCRLENEAQRRQQAVIDRQNRIAERQAIVPIVKNFLNDCAENFQCMSHEQAEKLSKFQQECYETEVVRKQQTLEEITERKALIHHFLEQSQTARAETSHALREKIMAFVNNERQETANLLDSFQAERQEFIPEQRKFLAGFIENLKDQELERRRCTREYLYELLDLTF